MPLMRRRAPIGNNPREHSAPSDSTARDATRTRRQAMPSQPENNPPQLNCTKTDADTRKTHETYQRIPRNNPVIKRMG